MTSAPRPQAAELFDELKASVGLAAALAGALADPAANTPRESIENDAARAAVLHTLPDAEAILAALWDNRRARGNNLLSVLSQATAAAAGSTRSWADQSDDTLIAQGRSSALVAPVIVDAIAPAYGLPASGDTLRVLDVGTGIGAIATALARSMPDAEITGIDIAERPLKIAWRLLAEGDADVAERVRYRQQDVLELPETGEYDLVWMPAPFIPDADLDAALDRVTQAIRPGGVVVLGTLRSTEHPRLRASEAWLAALAGGGTQGPDVVAEHLASRGYDAVRPFATVPGGPVLVAAIAPR